MKKIIGMLIVTALLLTCMPAFASGIEVYIDGQAVAFDDSTGYPFITEGRTLVPLRATMESYGAKVEWDGALQTAFVRQGTTTVRCVIGENRIFRNNVPVTNDAAAVIVNDRTYLPIRAVLEAFGAQVDWDGAVRVTSPTGESLIYEIENTPSVTSNYWKIWTSALDKKTVGDYTGAIETIKSISSVFIQKNDSASVAMLFKHLGECYANLNDYLSASACFKREAYYWSITPGMEQSRIDAQRRSGLINTSSQIYIRTTDKNMGGWTYFGAPHESQGGIYLGAYAEGDKNIYNPYDPDRFYMNTFPAIVGRDVGGYLLYLPYGQSVLSYQSHITRAKSLDKILQISLEPHDGLYSVNDSDGYLVQLATDMQNSGCKMMLRFAGEMNDESSKWYSADPSVYIEKFRMVANIFHTYAPSVPVIWAPNFYPADTMDDYYPGDEYVDYVGISSYMMHQPITDPLGQGVDRNRWSNQLDTIYSLYGHKKPIMIVEGGSSYMDYDTWADITEFSSYQIQDFYTYLPIKYPNVKLCFVFDSDEERRKFCLSNNMTYLEAYKAGIRSSDLFLSSDKDYQHHYYELGNNVDVKAEATELCSYLVTPENDIAYVIYSVNGVDCAPVYGAPYRINLDFTAFAGQKVTIGVRGYNSAYQQMTSQTITVNVK